MAACVWVYDQIGEVLVSGPNITSGYWNNQEQTEARFKDGWLCTGDLGYFDKDGDLYIIGRKDDMIIRAGVNIFPQEIENVLVNHQDVEEVVVWSEKQPSSGATIFAKIVARDQTEPQHSELIKYCNANLEPHLRPDKILIGNSITRNSSGKVVRSTVQNVTVHH